MPLAKIHVDATAFSDAQLEQISQAVRGALVDVLETPPDDFFQVIHQLPTNRFFHPPSFLGHQYSKEFILLEVTFGAGRPKEAFAPLLKELNRRVVEAAKIAPDDLTILLFEIGYDHFSFGRGVPGTAEVQ